MFGIGRDKTPSLDGYTIQFFKKAWGIVGEDVVAAILSYFQTNYMLPAFNSTCIALVPKSSCHNSIKDYRPISCCSVIYKCITKIIANRLKQFLPVIISGNQSAFIGGRSIADNVLLVHELVKGYGRRSLSLGVP